MYDELDQRRIALLSVLEDRLTELAEPEIGRQLRRLSGVTDRGMRRQKVVNMIADGCDRLGYLFMRQLWRTSQERNPIAKEILLDLMTSRPLSDSLGYTRVRGLYGQARLAGSVEISRLFLARPVQPWQKAGPDDDQENDQMASVALGVRKAYARKGDRNRLDRLLFDRNPAVIRNLLQNPRLVERDVIKIVTRRPVTAEVIQEVYLHPRWIVRYSVKRAIVFNPYTPVDIALPLLVHLHSQDLKELARQPSTEPVVRQAARERLALER